MRSRGTRLLPLLCLRGTEEKGAWFLKRAAAACFPPSRSTVKINNSHV